MTKYDKYSSGGDFFIPKTMQALVAGGVGFENLAVKEIGVPQIGPGQLLARVDAAGVCTSIIKLIGQGEEHPFLNGWDMKKWPIILGDEGAVTLVKIGDRLKDKYKAGQRFAIQPAVEVGPMLHRERYNKGAEGMRKCAVGYTLGGNLAQYIRIQEEVLQGQCLVPLGDDDLPYFAVSMAEPISCVYSAQERNWHIMKDSSVDRRKGHLGLLPGGTTVVVGAGTMGRMHAELALRFSPTVLIVCDLQQGRLDKVTKDIGQKAEQGNVKLICVTADKLSGAVKHASKGKGADDIILAVGVRQVQQEALSLLADGGVANLFGGLPKGGNILEVDGLDVHYRGIKVVGSSGGQASDVTAALEAIADKDIEPGNYIAAVGSLDNAVDVLKMIEQTKIDGRAILYPHIKHTPLQTVDYWDEKREEEFLNSRLI